MEASLLLRLLVVRAVSQQGVVRAGVDWCEVGCLGTRLRVRRRLRLPLYTARGRSGACPYSHSSQHGVSMAMPGLSLRRLVQVLQRLL